MPGSPLRAADAAMLVAVNVLWGSTYVVGRGVLYAFPPPAGTGAP